MQRYVVITGGVMSGLGKGITTSSIAKILQSMGFSVTAIKIDPYVNVDAGTMSPFEHGEVFVLEDGGEVDQDLGNYERFLDVKLTREHNITTGKVYQRVIEKERKGDYLGKTVQVIPHITDEIKGIIKSVSLPHDFSVIEVGGTVGDIESMPFLEAVRQLALEEQVVFVHVTLVPVSDVVGEQKTKPTQHSVKELRQVGISPTIIVCRSRKPLEEKIRGKIALFCNVHEDRVISAYDMDDIYKVPLLLESECIGEKILSQFGMKKRAHLKKWEKIISRHMKKEVRVALCGKYVHLGDSYISIKEALKHASFLTGVKARMELLDVETLDREELSQYDGIIVPIGYGPRGAEGKIDAIRYSRENGVPFLGLCFGMQLAVVEYARTILGLEKANSTEIDPKTPHPVIDLLPEQQHISHLGGTMRLGAYEAVIVRNTLAHRLYKKKSIFERHRHRWEVNPAYVKRLEEGGLLFSARSPNGIVMETLELPTHPFFLATQFHPEYTSRLENPSPPFVGFVQSMGKKKN
jgi:CTP synthase